MPWSIILSIYIASIRFLSPKPTVISPRTFGSNHQPKTESLTHQPLTQRPQLLLHFDTLQLLPRRITNLPIPQISTTLSLNFRIERSNQLQRTPNQQKVHRLFHNFHDTNADEATRLKGDEQLWHNLPAKISVFLGRTLFQLPLQLRRHARTLRP